MSRSEKTSETKTLKGILGGEKVPAHAPRLRAQMIADHGTPTYTPEAYRENHMGRGRMATSRLDDKIEGRRTAKIRSWRKASRKV